MIFKFLQLFFFLSFFKFGLSNTILEFKTWFKNNGGILTNLDIDHFKDMGYGIKVTKQITSDSEIIYIPSNLIFSKTNMKLSTDPIIQQVLKEFDSETSIIIWLLYEKLKLKDSFFYPYIQALPNYVSSLLYFNSDELEELQYPSFATEAKEFQSENIQMYEKLSIFANRMDDPILQSASKEDYIWAASIINSRGLRFKGEVYLAPMADFFNYQPHPDPRVASSGEFFLKHHKLGDSGDIRILSDRSESAENQLFEDYGDNTNQIYLKYHGFVPYENPFHCVSSSASSLKDFIQSATPKQKKLLMSLGFSKPPTTCIYNNGYLGKRLEVVLSVFSFNDQEVDTCLSYFAKSKIDWDAAYEGCGFRGVSEHFTERLSEAEEFSDEEDDLNSRVWKLSKSFLLNIPKQFTFNSSIKEDSQALQKLSAIPDNVSKLHLQLAIRFRLKYKQLLQKIFNIYELDPNSLNIPSSNRDIIGDKDFGSQPLTSIDTANSLNPSDDMTLDGKVAQFNKWFQAQNPQPSKIIAASIPGFRIGTIATDDIKKEDVYLGVPDKIIMSADVALKTPQIKDLLSSLYEKYHNHDDFHELLLFLIFEFFVRGRDSLYWPYLTLLPQPNEIDIPLFWSSEKIQEEISPSFLTNLVKKYQQDTQRKFSFIANITLIKDFFSPDILTQENYFWATAILDSRAIWWNGVRHLVPMLDFINCVQGKTDPNRLHSTTYDESQSLAITKSGDDFKKDEQLFENYGQPNHIYYVYHGFTLDENIHDCVHYEINLTPEERQRIDKDGYSGLLERLGLYRGTLIYRTCLNSNITPQTWSFLTLKFGLYKNITDRIKLSSPTQETSQFLYNHLTNQLKLYQESKIESKNLLKLEKKVLLQVKTVLQDLLNGFKSNSFDENDYDDEL